MNKKDYVNFENGSVELINLLHSTNYDSIDIDDIEYYPTPSLWDAMKWLEEVHHILVVVDYVYEYTDTSWVYKIYRLGENGKPERAEVTGVRYDKEGNPHTETIGYRDYELSYKSYATREEAEDEGIRYVLEKYDIDDINYGKSI